MATSPSTTPAPKKRLIVCCDGTWMDSDGNYQTPSNVTRIARAIPPTGLDNSVHPPQPITQVVFYQNGIGTGSKSLYTKYVGGITGEGLAEHIREAYSFICLNYNPGDDIILIGFSRGAFTARSISSLIKAVGLLTANGLAFFNQIFEDWEYQQNPDFRTKWPDIPFPNHKPPVTDPTYQKELLKRRLVRPGIKIKCVAVWDTVGGLGIPLVGLLPQPPSKDFAFVDTRVESNIEYAFQALALDEHRRAYAPTIWDWPKDKSDLKVLKQTWFPGVHSDIGGSYDDTALANLTLAWMVSQLEPLLTVDRGYLMELIRPTSGLLNPISNGENGTNNTHRGSIPRVNTHGTTRPWGLGKIHDSMTPFFRLGGSETRTPHEYREQESAAQHGTVLWIGKKVAHQVTSIFREADTSLKPRLAKTNETIHSSVRIRMGRHGYGYDDKGTYASEALQGWVMYGEETDPDTPIALDAPGLVGKMRDVVWKKAVPREETLDNGKVRVVNSGADDKTTLEIPEEPLGDFEREILKMWPEINNIFDTTGPGEHEHNVKRVKTFPPRGHHKGSGGGSGSGSDSSAGRDGLTLNTSTDAQRRIGTA
ncbi:hypothetical protein B0A52_04636 [Exophiala mesophila]|uniref:T6SS Phospholipase effector Tle1-like catalytic domain-containing protein n=1 Tax=Exophiala mesophila TaxID=212818 RepID=A0A438N8Z0_EXOME|nr:hypothetical protein B0A52_04636 [Exophiala mesophila]